MKLIREICFFTFFSFCAAIADDLSGRHLGALFSMTGFGALEGEADYNGMLLALEEDLQFQEKKLSLTLEDFQSDMAKTATSMNRLLGNKEIKVIVGPNWAEFLAVAAPIAQKKRIPLLSPTGYAKETFAANSCALIFFPPPRSWVKPLTKKLAGKKVVTITTTNQYFEQLETSIGEEVTIVEKNSVGPQETNFTPLISRLSKRSDIDGIVVLLLETNFNVFLRQAKAAGLSIPLYAANQVSHDTVVMRDLSLAEGVIFFDYKVLSTKKFLDAYRLRFNKEPREGSSLSYDAGKLALKILRECSSAADACTCAKQLRLEGESGPVSFDDTGKRLFDAEITELRQVRSGKIVAIQ